MIDACLVGRSAAVESVFLIPWQSIFHPPFVLSKLGDNDWKEGRQQPGRMSTFIYRETICHRFQKGSSAVHKQQSTLLTAVCSTVVVDVLSRTPSLLNSIVLLRDMKFPIPHSMDVQLSMHFPFPRRPAAATTAYCSQGRESGCG